MKPIPQFMQKPKPRRWLVLNGHPVHVRVSPYGLVELSRYKRDGRSFSIEYSFDTLCVNWTRSPAEFFFDTKKEAYEKAINIKKKDVAGLKLKLVSVADDITESATELSKLEAQLIEIKKHY